MQKIKWIAIYFSFLIPLILSAEDSPMMKKMKAFYHKNGIKHWNSPSAFEGQKGGYLTGGGLKVSNSAYNNNVVTVQLPCATRRLFTNGGRIHVKSTDPIHSLPSLESYTGNR